MVLEAFVILFKALLARRNASTSSQERKTARFRTSRAKASFKCCCLASCTSVSSMACAVRTLTSSRAAATCCCCSPCCKSAACACAARSSSLRAASAAASAALDCRGRQVGRQVIRQTGRCQMTATGTCGALFGTHARGCLGHANAHNSMQRGHKRCLLLLAACARTSSSGSAPVPPAVISRMLATLSAGFAS